MRELVDGVRHVRAIILATFDGLCWFVSIVALAGLTRDTNKVHEIGVAVLVAVVAACLHAAVGVSVHLHQGRSAVASFEDLVALTSVAGVVGAGLVIADFVAGMPYPPVAMVGAPTLALVLMVWGRAIYRLQRDRGPAAELREHGEPVVVLGAGDGAQQLLTSMVRDPHGTWRPLALLDDDRYKRYRRIRGVSVVGSLRDFPTVARECGARTVILAIPSAPRKLVQHLLDVAKAEGLALKVLPSHDQLLEPGRVTITDVRDIDVTDLLGRNQIDTDVASIADYLTGKRVLVTGAGGSIGSELCRQIVKFDPAELIMLDRDESALHAVELSIFGRGLLDSPNTVLGNIRDARTVREIFEDRRPEVVFHAAALKHLPLLEKAPGEAVKTNVWGSLNVLEAAAAVGVKRFVNVSTDKAANPTSVLGYSKRLAEGLTAATAAEASGTYLSVRFGNVLGSRGSVLTAFTAQIAKGGPITVTHPDITRFFMTVQEAVQLVIQAAAVGEDSDVLVLDMGEPVSIDGVARQLIELSGKDIDIVYTGLRPGEKMHEELFGAGEGGAHTRHPLISQTSVQPFEAIDAHAIDAWADNGTIIGSLQAACSRIAADGSGVNATVSA